MNSIVVVPAYETGRGGGHIVRSRELVQSLRRRGSEAFLYLPPEQANRGGEWVISDIRASSLDLIILDRFRTSVQEFTFWRKKAPILGIDEGGRCRQYCDFLIDMLPALPQRHPPNTTAPRLLPLPKTRRLSFAFVPEGKKIQALITFGMEDPARLTVPVACSLAKDSRLNISVIAPAEAAHALPDGIQALKPVADLREELAGYDLIITHFGLTAFEAIYAKVPVVLFSPSRYHQKLAAAAGFETARLGERLELDEGLLDRCRRIAARFDLESQVEFEALSELLVHLPPAPQVCPACGEPLAPAPVLARFADRTYRLCPACKMALMLRLTPPPLEYADDYFFDLYKKQYGLTYLEDFPQLVQRGKKRLNTIQKLHKGGKRLLDIGCAYGPFLTAAREAGFSPLGIDPAENAVRYVTQTLGMQALQGFFPHASVSEMVFDVISLWFVIEHFPNLSAVLTALHRMLPSGGVLALSTPSSTGISGRSSLKNFLAQSPADHWTIWSPQAAAKLLKRYGFTLKKTVICGHHPERFPLLGKVRLLHPALRFISALLRLGDTFEIYAVRD
ncbi:MAG: methyltransferase domain-containing protein [Spirochaetaceae bacterium]|jgi:2-polyprenyl-3-methyl-5-hydroxy-6-metoxy-1,4-benzoquinol methylase/spore coat polysaccharide biosynthesis predicted glycosyltransferase SpsG|nr:methyltransferase domain-containing protein [Spirochaetaceae bacterium]